MPKTLMPLDGDELLLVSGGRLHFVPIIPGDKMMLNRVGYLLDEPLFYRDIAMHTKRVEAEFVRVSTGAALFARRGLKNRMQQSMSIGAFDLVRYLVRVDGEFFSILEKDLPNLLQ